ncbi:FMRFamide receptor-like [Littorina saxatilis]|uniref:FMRFamide receptor-like n=1 Tax=Littorina saxatilis TaxID=31220 RepID=UPI0038B6061E
MKALAVSDFFNIAIIVLSGPLLITEKGYVIAVVVVGFIIPYISTVTAYITMAVVFTRWLAVHKPTKVRAILTKRRVVVSYVLVLIWSLVTWVPAFIALLTKSSRYDAVLNFITGSLSLILPVMVTLFLNVSLACKLCRHRTRTDLGQLTNSAARAQSSSRFNRLVTVVVCMSVTTFFTYPAGFIVMQLIMLNQCIDSCKAFSIGIAFLLTVFNASINVVYYLLCSSQFRELFRRRLCCCFRRKNQPVEMTLGEITPKAEAFHLQ